MARYVALMLNNICISIKRFFEWLNKRRIETGPQIKDAVRFVHRSCARPCLCMFMGGGGGGVTVRTEWDELWSHLCVSFHIVFRLVRIVLLKVSFSRGGLTTLSAMFLFLEVLDGMWNRRGPQGTAAMSDARVKWSEVLVPVLPIDGDFTEKVGSTRVPASTLSQVPAILTDFSWFSSVSPGRCRKVPSSRQRQLPSTSSSLHYSLPCSHYSLSSLSYW
jgi:hypothetical protein